MCFPYPIDTERHRVRLLRAQQERRLLQTRRFGAKRSICSAISIHDEWLNDALRASFVRFSADCSLDIDAHSVKYPRYRSTLQMMSSMSSGCNKTLANVESLTQLSRDTRDRFIGH